MQTDGVIQELRRLRIAVWVLAALSILNLAFGLFGRSSYRSFELAAPPMTPIDSIPANPWEGLTIAQKIDLSSVVLVTHNIRVGDREKVVVSEFLKRSPNTEVFYSVGDEIPHMSHDIKPNTRSGEGSLVFLEGSPASIRESYAIYDGRIPGFGDIPLAKIKRDMRTAR